MQSGFLIFARFGWFFPSACEDVLTPAAVADSALKVLTNCLATMPAGMFMHKIVAQPLFFVVLVGYLSGPKRNKIKQNVLLLFAAITKCNRIIKFN